MKIKSFLLLCLCVCFCKTIFAQEKKPTWFDDRVVIGQSLSSIKDGEQDPSQLTATFPDKGASSYLINLGVSVSLTGAPKKSNSFFRSGVQAEYNRNTLTDKPQNNVQFGYNMQAVIIPDANKLSHGITGAITYAYDGIDISNSVIANIMLTPILSGHHFNINANILTGRTEKNTLFIAPYAGVQLQDVFAASKDSLKGFIFRPVFSLSMKYTLREKNTVPGIGDPIFFLSASYTGRWDAANSTKVQEGYTKLFTASAQYYIISNPVKVSVGPSFHYGSDPMKGLKQQQYWLLSLNVSKNL